MKIGQKIGLAGAATLFIGAFLPFASMPIVGNINYIQGDGKVVAGIAVLAAIVALVKVLELLYALSVLAFAIICFNLKDALKAPIQLEFGIAVMIIGCIVLFVAAYKRND